MSDNTSKLMDQLIRIEGLLKRYQIFNFRNFGPFANHHRGQGRVLQILKLKPEISQKEISYLLDMRNQSLGELLSKLEKNGYITRTPSEKDRRVMDIRLTEEGAEAAEDQDNSEPDKDKFFDCLNDEEQQIMTGYLDRIIDNIEKEMSNAGIDDTPFDGSFRQQFFENFNNPDFHPGARPGGGHFGPGFDRHPHNKRSFHQFFSEFKGPRAGF